jgi:hypothetical protein
MPEAPEPALRFVLKGGILATIQQLVAFPVSGKSGLGSMRGIMGESWFSPFTRGVQHGQKFLVDRHPKRPALALTPAPSFSPRSSLAAESG